MTLWRVLTPFICRTGRDEKLGMHGYEKVVFVGREWGNGERGGCGDGEIFEEFGKVVRSGETENLEEGVMMMNILRLMRIERVDSEAFCCPDNIEC